MRACTAQIAEMEEPAAAAKGLYSISNLVDNNQQRGAFYNAGGLQRMQGVLANASVSDRIHRKVASLFGDLALQGEVVSSPGLEECSNRWSVLVDLCTQCYNNGQ